MSTPTLLRSLIPRPSNPCRFKDQCICACGERGLGIKTGLTPVHAAGMGQYDEPDSGSY